MIHFSSTLEVNRKKPSFLKFFIVFLVYYTRMIFWKLLRSLKQLLIEILKNQLTSSFFKRRTETEVYHFLGLVIYFAIFR